MTNDNNDKKGPIRDPRWEVYWEFIRQSEKDENNLDEYNILTNTDYETRK